MNLFYRRSIIFLVSIPLLIAGNSNVSNMKKMAVEKVEEQAKLIQEMVDMIYSFGELGFQEFETSKYLTTSGACRGLVNSAPSCLHLFLL